MGRDDSARRVGTGKGIALTTPFDPKAKALHPWDGFLVGPENALAHAGVMMLARGGDEGLSPLVLHGPSGSGKSRLLAGLVAERVTRRPDAVVAQIDAETFAALCADAMTRPEAWTELRGRFRTLDLFVLEDVHGLERAPLALEELSHTLDALAERGADVAVSATTPPGAWTAPSWPSRLVNRLVGGLSVRIDPPGEASRRRYLLEQARGKGLAVSADAVDTLAAKGAGYRDLDGFLHRLALDSKLGRKAIDGTLAGDLLDTEGAAAGEVTIETIAGAVARRFGVRVHDLRSASRRAALVEPRHIAMHLARVWTSLSFARIGTYFGKRDPKTVRHACQMAAQRIHADPALAAVIETIAGGWKSVAHNDAEGEKRN